jgi:hypothetical protein
VSNKVQIKQLNMLQDPKTSLAKCFMTILTDFYKLIFKNKSLGMEIKKFEQVG